MAKAKDNVNERMLDYIGAAFDKATQQPGFDTMSIDELKAAAEAQFAQQQQTQTAGNTGDIGWEKYSPPPPIGRPARLPDPFAPQHPFVPQHDDFVPHPDQLVDAAALQKKVDMLEEKIAILWDLFKMKAKE